MRAHEIVLELDEQEDPDRRDVPNRCLCMLAYRIAQAGGSFQSYEVHHGTSRACGGGLQTSRRSRKIAKKIGRAAAEMLRDTDRELLRKCMEDWRKGSWALRVRLVMGDGWPQGLRGDVSGGESPLDPYSREVVGESCRFIVLVERLLSPRT